MTSEAGLGVGLLAVVRKTGDALDLDKLTGVTEGGHTQQRARWAGGRQTVGNYVPHCDEVLTIADDIHGRLDQILGTSTESIENPNQILQRDSGLSHGVPDPNDISLLVEGTRTCREEERTGWSDGSVFVRHVSIQRTDCHWLLVGHTPILPQRRPLPLSPGRRHSVGPPVGQDVQVDLDVVASLVEQQRSTWEQHGIEVEFRQSREYGSASVTCEGPVKIAQLVVWTSGAADLGTAREDLPQDDPSWHLYGIISESELPGCVGDLSKYLLTDD
jgi:hypothetical protein